MLKVFTQDYSSEKDSTFSSFSEALSKITRTINETGRIYEIIHVKDDGILFKSFEKDGDFFQKKIKGTVVVMADIKDLAY